MISKMNAASLKRRRRCRLSSLTMSAALHLSISSICNRPCGPLSTLAAQPAGLLHGATGLQDQDTFRSTGTANNQREVSLYNNTIVDSQGSDFNKFVERKIKTPKCKLGKMAKATARTADVPCNISSPPSSSQPTLSLQPTFQPTMQPTDGPTELPTAHSVTPTSLPTSHTSSKPTPVPVNISFGSFVLRVKMATPASLINNSVLAGQTKMYLENFYRETMDESMGLNRINFSLSCVDVGTFPVLYYFECVFREGNIWVRSDGFIPSAPDLDKYNQRAFEGIRRFDYLFFLFASENSDLLKVASVEYATYRENAEVQEGVLTNSVKTNLIKKDFKQTILLGFFFFSFFVAILLKLSRLKKSQQLIDQSPVVRRSPDCIVVYNSQEDEISDLSMDRLSSINSL
uniref:Uncharacterized protein n=1 Tax=Corethron hystrix TaxID=216773 RepID=A0A7S1FVK0_9STRA|mmetsp:Transcript_3539/g.6542  ORF Transcript_3539/g.6542 Transcript_3539/m.6542 type:complete len:402 (+) Transcript_3539:181-1386(+)